MLSRRFILAFSVTAVVATLAGADLSRAETPTVPLTVLAASSLSEALPRIGAAWEAKGNGAVVFSFDSSSKLSKQIEGGVPADGFFSADLDWMDYLERKDLIAPSSRVVVCGNTLVAVVRREAPFVPNDAMDLANFAVERIALGGENVPAGKYARSALRSLGAWDAVKDRVVNGDNVRTALAWVAAGEAEAGVVYATDARVASGVEIAFTFPTGSHPSIVYPAAAVTRSAHVEDMRRFLAFCQSAEGQAIFAAAGFLPSPRCD